MIFCSVIIPSRDGGADLKITLRSLLDQTVSVSIIVCDDHSVIESQKILAGFPEVNVIRNPVRESKRHERIGSILNMGWKSMRPAKYYMISGDDTLFPHDYIERVTALMERDGTAVGSGHARKYNKTAAPDGSGRIYTSELWIQLMPFIENSGWESGMMIKARHLGYSLMKYPVKKTHLRPYSIASVRNDGYASWTLGNPLVWTVLTSLKQVWKKQKTLDQVNSKILGHIEYMHKGKPRVEFWERVRVEKWNKIKGKMIYRFVTKPGRRIREWLNLND